MSALLDAAKQAALDEVAAIGSTASSYVIGRAVEAAARVLGHPAPPEPEPLDVDSWEAE